MRKQTAHGGLQKIEKRNILRKKPRLWKRQRLVFSKIINPLFLAVFVASEVSLISRGEQRINFL